jgi:hypothetical protein
MNTYHLKLAGDEWVLMRDGEVIPVACFDSKHQAATAAKTLVEQRTGSLTIHAADGTIEEMVNYPSAPQI